MLSSVLVLDPFHWLGMVVESHTQKGGAAGQTLSSSITHPRKQEEGGRKQSIDVNNQKQYYNTQKERIGYTKIANVLQYSTNALSTIFIIEVPKTYNFLDFLPLKDRKFGGNKNNGFHGFPYSFMVSEKTGLWPAVKEKS